MEVGWKLSIPSSWNRNGTLELISQNIGKAIKKLINLLQTHNVQRKDATKSFNNSWKPLKPPFFKQKGNRQNWKGKGTDIEQSGKVDKVWNKLNVGIGNNKKCFKLTYFGGGDCFLSLKECWELEFLLMVVELQAVGSRMWDQGDIGIICALVPHGSAFSFSPLKYQIRNIKYIVTF